MTLRTVAERVGVSMMTVSNVINSTGKVGAKTRARVRQAIRETGYIPNYEARRLASAGLTRVGLIYANLQTPFLSQILLAALDATAASGTQLLVRNGKRPSKKEAASLALSLFRSGAQGLLLIPPYAELLAGNPVLAEARVAAIATAGPLPGMHTVRIDNRAAARTLTAFLVRLGHRRIGFITGSLRNGDSLERLAGYKDALGVAEIPVLPELIRPGEFTFDSGRAAAQQLLGLQDRPTAIVASNDDMAAGTAWAAQQRGLKLPDDLSVTGFDDTPTALKTWPPLTVIRQPIAAMVERGVSLLTSSTPRVAGSEPHDTILEYELVERESTTRRRKA
ncbi:MAG TPA: LacI family DNA-binding transcriptional regulator [Povalibacter sp.]|nr:LacI family DNA-binding transcriptional regulator [Povalibacter sp.]